MSEILRVNNLCVDYNNYGKITKAVKNVSFSINDQDVLGIVGESGSGKSTMVMAILKLLDPNTTNITGEVYYNDLELIGLNESEYSKLRQKEISVVFQKSMNSLSPVHKIINQVIDIYRVHSPNSTKKEVEERFSYILSLMNLKNRIMYLYPHELSGGMMQRVSIAISLLFSPKLLIMDESTTALDVVTQGKILDEISEIQKQMEMTRIMITHDMSVVAENCNKVAVMYNGEILEFGNVKEIFKNPSNKYTKSLIDSFPSLYGERKIIKSFDGFDK